MMRSISIIMQYYYSNSDDWMLPAIIDSVIGGALVYGYSRPPAPVYYPQVPVYQQLVVNIRG